MLQKLPDARPMMKVTPVEAKQYFQRNGMLPDGPHNEGELK